ncbi:MAG: hypothetical protein KG003_06740 [Bacteroidetes bacterium]|nr:hypothetical protein [Bacteroidota bacterium]
MRLKLPFLFFLFFVLFNSASLKGSNASGGYWEYSYLGNNKYLLNFGVLRDCRGIPLSGISFGFYAGTNYGNGCKQDTIQGFVLTSMKTVTRYCSSISDPCYPHNSNSTGSGIELLIYSRVVDLNSSKFSSYVGSSACGDITFYANKCCRSGAITTGHDGEDFYVVTTLHTENLSKCINQNNNSGKWLNHFPAIICCATPVFHNFGFTDSTDRDSISYSMAPAQRGIPINSVSYTSPFKYQTPITVYCPGSGGLGCTPNITADPPRGMYLNDKTGDIVFTPVNCTDVATIAVQATEWRKDKNNKWVKIASILYETMVIIKDNCDYNKIPKITGTTSSKICAGDKICLTIDVTDDKFTPYQSVADTVHTSWILPIPNATITVQSDTFPNKEKLEFCWQTTSADTQDFAYQFEIIAHDGSCNVSRESSRAFTIQVQKKDEAKISVSPVQPCNNITLQASTLRYKESTPTFEWIVTDSLTGKKIFGGNKSTEFISYLQKGGYKITLRTTSVKFCYPDVVQYISIRDSLPTVTLQRGIQVCTQQKFNILAVTSNAKNPITYTWTFPGGIDSTGFKDNYNLIYSDTSTIRIQATDSNGCIMKDTAAVIVWELPKIAWISDPLNTRCHDYGDFNLDPLLIEPFSGLRTNSNFRIYGSLTKFGAYGLVDSIKPDEHYFRTTKINNALELSSGKSVTETITAWFRDTNGCENSATTKQKINGNPIIELTDKTFCQNMLGEITADSFVIKPKIKFGAQYTWTAVTCPSGVNLKDVFTNPSLNEYYFQGGSKGVNTFAGEYILRLKIVDLLTGCTDSESNKVTLLSEPVMDTFSHKGVCVNGSAVDLTKLFKSNGNPVTVGESNFRITAFNGDTNSTFYKNIVLKNGYIFPTNVPWGKYTVLCTNRSTGCDASTLNYILIRPLPQAEFTTNPKDTAPKNLPYFVTKNTTKIASGENMTFEWYTKFPSLSDKSTAFEPVITYPLTDSGYLVRMIALTASGCRDTFDKVLIVGTGKYIFVRSIEGKEFKIDSRISVLSPEYRVLQTDVYDESGRLVHSFLKNEGVDLKSGIYFYVIYFQSPDGQIMVYKSKISL